MNKKVLVTRDNGKVGVVETELWVPCGNLELL